MKSPVPRTSQAPRKVSFDNGGEFIRETRRDVEQYLRPRWTRLRGGLQLYAKTVAAFGLMVASWTALDVLRSPASGLRCSASSVSRSERH